MTSIINITIETTEDMHAFVRANLSAGRRYITNAAAFDLMQNEDREFAFMSRNDAASIDCDPLTRTRDFIDLHDGDLVLSDEENMEAHSGAYTGNQIHRSRHMSGSLLRELLMNGEARIIAETTTEQRGPRTKTVNRYYVVIA